VHVADNQTVDGATIVEATTDMGPGGMPKMMGEVEQLPSDRPGLHRLATETGMAGKWMLVIGAKIRGEQEVIRTRVAYDAGS
jgi:hypothetical protein